MARNSRKMPGGVIENDIIDITPKNCTDMHTALHQLLRWFNLNWGLMRAVMLATGTVILGLAALAVLQIGEFIPQDLDIYVTSKNLAVVLMNFITYYSIICLYPQWTMHKAALVRAGVLDYQAIYKYCGHRFNMLHR
jgi:hypothetical protein